MKVILSNLRPNIYRLQIRKLSILFKYSYFERETSFREVGSQESVLKRFFLKN